LAGVGVSVNVLYYGFLWVILKKGMEGKGQRSVIVWPFPCCIIFSGCWIKGAIQRALSFCESFDGTEALAFFAFEYFGPGLISFIIIIIVLLRPGFGILSFLSLQ
jgi:hypothetical protein